MELKKVFDRTTWLCRVCNVHNVGTLLCSGCTTVRPSLPKVLKNMIAYEVNEARGLYNYWQTPLAASRANEIAESAAKGIKFNYAKEVKPVRKSRFQDTRMADGLKKAGFKGEK